MANKTVQQIISKIKWAFTLALILLFAFLFLGLLLDKLYFAACCLLSVDLLLIAFLFKPQITRKKAFNSSAKRVGICTALVLVCLISFPLRDRKFKSDLKNGVAKTTFNNEKLSASILDFVSKNKNYFVIRNTDSLIEVNNLFSEIKAPKWSFSNVFFSVNKDSQFALYKPFATSPLISKKYLGPIPNLKYITDYQVKFHFDWNYKITTVSTLLISDDSTKVLQNDFLFADYFRQNIIAERRQEIKKEEEIIASREKRELQVKKFKENCFSAWEGSCDAVESYVKKRMNDPDSYEHVETKFWDMGDYAVVVMKYRGKNALGGKVLNAIKAKVSWDCEMLEVMEILN